MLTVRHDRSLSAAETIEGVRVLRLRPVARISRGMIAPGLPVAVARLLGSQDVAHVHTPLPEALAVAWLARRARRPLVMTHQGDLVMPAGLRNQAIERSGTALLAATARRADAVTTLSADYAEHSRFLRPFLPKLTAIPPPSDLPPPDPGAARWWRRELGLEDRAVVGFAGRFVEEKGFDYLLSAVPALAARVPNVHLLYAGEHAVAYERFYERCRPLLEAHRDRVTFTGLIRDRVRLASFYALCDVFALPSRTDCFGLVQLEAMRCGTPVVATDIPGAREPVGTTGMGLLVRPRDTAALADGLARVLADRERYAAARPRVEEAYNASASIDRYEQILAEVVGRAQAGA